MEVVGEVLLSSGLELLLKTLASSELLQFARKKKVDAELKKWEGNLLTLNEVLNDAEMKQMTSSAVKNWLCELRDLAYDAEDVLDEFATELLRHNLMAERPQMANTNKGFALANISHSHGSFSLLFGRPSYHSLITGYLELASSKTEV